jgi:hypothetical protein
LKLLQGKKKDIAVVIDQDVGESSLPLAGAIQQLRLLFCSMEHCQILILYYPVQ